MKKITIIIIILMISVSNFSFATENYNDDKATVLNFKDILFDKAIKMYPTYMPENHERYLIAIKKYQPKEAFRLVNLNKDIDFYEQKYEIDNLDTKLILVNKFYGLPKEYIPSDLINVPKKYTDGKDFLLDAECLNETEKMIEDAKKEGIILKINSAYRSYKMQKELYDRYVIKYGFESAERRSARAGHSEHQTGLAVDFKGDVPYFSKSEGYQWMLLNARKYGFILRYKDNNTDITGYMPESWHWRYVGKEYSEKIELQEITLEEYLLNKVIKESNFNIKFKEDIYE